MRRIHLILIVLASLAACVPWVKPLQYDNYVGGTPYLDLLEPDIGPVLGEPNELFLVRGTFWTRYRCRWFSSGDDYAWTEVAQADVPSDVRALPRGPYGSWGCQPGVHGW
ncbi:MAG: hypothetical protein ACYDCL_04475 [Myxococcales bacterium]